MPLVAGALVLDVQRWNYSDQGPAELWVFSGVCVVVRLGLLLRWRWPAAVFLTQLTFAVTLPSVLGLMPMEAGVDLGLLLGLHAVARQRAWRTSVMAGVACVIPSGLAVRLSAPNFAYGVFPLGSFVMNTALMALPSVVVWMLGYWMRRAALARMSAEVAERARRVERQQTARELHDIVSHTVTVMLLQAAGARTVLDTDPARARRALAAVQDAGVQAMAEMRRMLTLMRLPTDAGPSDHGVHQPGLERLRKLGRRYAADVLLVAVALFVDVYVWIGDVNDPTARWTLSGIDAIVLLSLLVRWRRPVAVFVAQVVYAAILIQVLPESDPIFGLFLAVHILARRRERRTSIAVSLICAVPIGLHLLANDDGFDAAIYAVSLEIYAFLVAVAWVLGYWMRRAALARASAEVAERARRVERQQTARELHDIVSHTVTVMLLQAAGARTVLDTDPAQARRALAAVQDAGVQAMAELRRMLTVMRLPTDAGPADHGVHQPGLERLDELVRQMGDIGLTVTVQTTGTPVLLDPSVNLTAYRVVQEALTNSTKYASQDSIAGVRLDWTTEKLLITIADHAGGRPRRRPTIVPSTGHGLIGLRERVDAIGGRFQSDPGADGFVVTATLPTPSRRNIDTG